MTRKNNAGQALIFAVATLGILLMGFAGMGIDMGMMRTQKRLLQNGSDGGAIAGADELRYTGGSPSTAASDALVGNGLSGASLQVDTACPTTVATLTVTVNNPPLSGPHASNSNYVEVCVAQLQPTYFMRILGINNETVSARAVATLVGESGTNPGCIYQLQPAGSGGIGVTTSGTPTLQASSCGIEVNGNFTTNGNKVNIDAGSIGVVGTDTNNGGGTVTCGGSSSNCPVTGIPPSGDPLSYLPPPCTSCTGGQPIHISGGSCTGGGCTGVVCNAGTCTIQPGTYSQIIVDANQNVVFASGTYIIDGNFTINAGTTDTGNGVTFYITGGGAVTINGGATSQLSAPNSGTYAGILFDQDPTDTSAAKIDGTSSSYFQGALYFPGAQLNFGGNSTFTNSQSAYTIIVVADLKLAGTSTVDLNSNYSSLPGGVSIIENAILVE